MAMMRIETIQVEVNDANPTKLNVENLTEGYGSFRSQIRRFVIHIENLDDTTTLYIGNKNVTPETGYAIFPTKEKVLKIPNGVDIYGITESGTIQVSLLEILR